MEKILEQQHNDNYQPRKHFAACLLEITCSSQLLDPSHKVIVHYIIAILPTSLPAMNLPLPCEQTVVINYNMAIASYSITIVREYQLITHEYMIEYISSL